jgi:hypothetical protein
VRLAEILDRGGTVIAECYDGTHWRLQRIVRRKRPELLREGVTIFDANFMPHTANRKHEI